jgi:flagellin-like hook-associated protein FlgL
MTIKIDGSANASLNDTDRASLQEEVAGLQAEIGRATTNTQFNGVAPVLPVPST